MSNVLNYATRTLGTSYRVKSSKCYALVVRNRITSSKRTRSRRIASLNVGFFMNAFSDDGSESSEEKIDPAHGPAGKILYLYRLFSINSSGNSGYRRYLIPRSRI